MKFSDLCGILFDKQQWKNLQEGTHYCFFRKRLATENITLIELIRKGFSMYRFIERLHSLYGLLQDEQSKEIFQARLAMDMENSIPNIKRLISLGRFKGRMFWEWSQPQKDLLKKMTQERNKLILYGTGYPGQIIAKALQFEHIDFYGFCGQDAERFPDGLFGKPVISPDELVTHSNKYYVVLTVANPKSHMEISKFLQEHNYPSNHILDWVTHSISIDEEKQYFEFPKLYRRGTAFIDGGCYDCKTSYSFAKWCGGIYSSIIAFEPHPDCYARCCKNVHDVPLPNFQLINAGLSDQEGTAMFEAMNTKASHIIAAEPDSNQAKTNSTGIISIRTVAIDDIVGEQSVGFIKMDIEGAEYNALHGAKNTILRDKPLLAICVYHLRGDVFAIMDYLHSLLPEYRFLLRHYSSLDAETVLYASVDL